MHKRFDRLSVDETTLVFAFRYALGRRSTAPSHMVAALNRHWGALADWTQRQIRDEIAGAIRRCEAGRPCDVDTWTEVLTWVMKDKNAGYVSTDGNAHS